MPAANSKEDELAVAAAYSTEAELAVAEANSMGVEWDPEGVYSTVAGWAVAGALDLQLMFARDNSPRPIHLDTKKYGQCKNFGMNL